MSSRNLQKDGQYTIPNWQEQNTYENHVVWPIHKDFMWVNLWVNATKTMLLCSVSSEIEFSSGVFSPTM